MTNVLLQLQTRQNSIVYGTKIGIDVKSYIKAQCTIETSGIETVKDNRI